MILFTEAYSQCVFYTHRVCEGPAKKRTMAMQPYRAPLAESINPTLTLMDSPAPKLDEALNIPDPHN